MGEKEGLKVKNKGRNGAKLKKESENGRNLMNFAKTLTVLGEMLMQVLERE